MTREEAIRHLAHLQTIGTLSDETLSAFALAEKALETENAVIDRVLEIVEFERVDPKFVGGEGYEYLSYAAGWENCAHTIIDKVLSLKGEQE